MYNLVIIRLRKSTKEFQNTEFIGLKLLWDVEQELACRGASYEQLKELQSMTKGDVKITEIEDEINDKLYFCYISKIN